VKTTTAVICTRLTRSLSTYTLISGHLKFMWASHLSRSHAGAGVLLKWTLIFTSKMVLFKKWHTIWISMMLRHRSKFKSDCLNHLSVMKANRNRRARAHQDLNRSTPCTMAISTLIWVRIPKSLMNGQCLCEAVIHFPSRQSAVVWIVSHSICTLTSSHLWYTWASLHFRLQEKDGELLTFRLTF